MVSNGHTWYGVWCEGCCRRLLLETCMKTTIVHWLNCRYRLPGSASGDLDTNHVMSNYSCHVLRTVLHVAIAWCDASLYLVYRIAVLYRKLQTDR